MISKLEMKGFAKIEKIVEKKAQEIEENYYHKYKHLYELCMSIIQKYNVLLYGGSAINEIFPADLKFYSETEQPDVDIFCVQTTFTKMRTDLIGTFLRNGYRITTIKEALHVNTYKLFTEGLHLLDITIVKKDLFKSLEIGKIYTSFKLYTVNIHYLKYSLHTFISQPMDAHRWTAIFDRLSKFYKAYPVNLKISLDLSAFYIPETVLPESVHKSVNKYISEQGLISFGWDVIEDYILEHKTNIDLLNSTFMKNKAYIPVKYVSILTNAKTVAETLKSLIDDPHISISKNKLTHSILPPIVVISYKNHAMIYLFETNNCSSYITYKTRQQLSIHSIIRYLYLIYFGTENNNLLAAINILTSAFIHNISSRKTIYKQFVPDCYGQQKGIVTLRKDKYMRLNNFLS